MSGQSGDGGGRGGRPARPRLGLPARAPERTVRDPGAERNRRAAPGSSRAGKAGATSEPSRAPRRRGDLPREFAGPRTDKGSANRQRGGTPRARGEPAGGETSPDNASHALFSPCPRGLEAALRDELVALGASDCRPVPGGVAWSGDWAAIHRANLGSRIASRVLLRIAGAPYAGDEDLYRLARAVDWKRRFPVSHSIRVDITAIRAPLRSLEFATLRVKDAICDRFRDDLGRRPGVDTRHPDARIAVFLDAREATLYLDTSGEPLWKRGWRTDSEFGADRRDHDTNRGVAPLRENLAAGLIALTGWNGRAPFADPMCGSGTIAIEAAQIALAIPPGHARRFGFERLLGFDAALWSRVREQALAARRPVQRLELWATDREMRAVERTRAALRAAGLEGAVHTRAVDILKFAPPPLDPGDEGVMLCNPPYGVRLEQQSSLEAFYPKLGDALKAHFAGWRCHLFSGDPALARGIRLHPSRRTPLYNGALECRLYEYRMVTGSNRRD